MIFRKLFDRIDSFRLENVSKKYGDHFAAKDLNLEVQGGELLILIGRSGSGKTTALRMINRLIEPDSGKISVNGVNINEFDPIRLRRNIGYVIQNIGLLPHLRVSENIGLILKLEGWKEKEILERVRSLLDFVSLPPEIFMNRFPHELSGGQQQRVGFARAMAMNPPLYPMDEPFGVLDPLLRAQLQDEFYKIKKELGKTIVFVTHDINEAFRLGDRIGIMDNAEFIQVVTPDELIFSPANALVAEIVDSERKYRHIDALKVKDMMQPLDKKQILYPELSAAATLDSMFREGLEVAFILKNSDNAGHICLTEVLKAASTGKSLEEASKPVPALSSEMSLLEGLTRLKTQGEHTALILEREKPIGILFSDRILLNLI